MTCSCIPPNYDINCKANGHCMSTEIKLFVSLSEVPPMPEGFTDRTAWDAIHWKFNGGGLLDEAVMGWQLDNQDRVRAAAKAAERAANGVQNRLRS